METSNNTTMCATVCRVQRCCLCVCDHCTNQEVLVHSNCACRFHVGRQGVHPLQRCDDPEHSAPKSPPPVLSAFPADQPWFRNTLASSERPGYFLGPALQDSVAPSIGADGQAPLFPLVLGILSPCRLCFPSPLCYTELKLNRCIGRRQLCPRPGNGLESRAVPPLC